jgi:hypothetical protein
MGGADAGIDRSTCGHWRKGEHAAGNDLCCREARVHRLASLSQLLVGKDDEAHASNDQSNLCNDEGGWVEPSGQRHRDRELQRDSEKKRKTDNGFLSFPVTDACGLVEHNGNHPSGAFETGLQETAVQSP